jgi:hypothetical protein
MQLVGAPLLKTKASKLISEFTTVFIHIFVILVRHDDGWTRLSRSQENVDHVPGASSITPMALLARTLLTRSAEQPRRVYVALQAQLLSMIK